MRAVEDRMWWYRGLHANLLATLKLRLKVEGAVLDAGCGTGGLLRRLSDALPGRALIGIDREPLAVAATEARGCAAVALGSVASLPFPDSSLAAIVSADVLYHRAVDQSAVLAEFRRCLRPGGVLVLNLPAYEWMRSSHDEAVHGARRYTASGVRTMLQQAGFRRIACTYWNSILFPLMAARRRLLPSSKTSDVGLYPAPIEAVFSFIMAVENAAIRVGLGFRFGGSVLAAAEV
jgi:SAM-dependent methyltransferase